MNLRNIFCCEDKDFSRDISRRRVPSSVVVVYLRTLKIIPSVIVWISSCSNEMEFERKVVLSEISKHQQVFQVAGV